MYWPSLNKSRTMYRIFTFVLSLALILAFSMPVEFSSAAPYQERINGFRVTQNGQFNINGSVSTGWTTGNLGNTWAEGEWVPYQVVITGVQSQYPGLNGLPNIEVKYDFTGGSSKGYPRFVDLVKGVQAGTTELAANAGYPSAGGTPVVINTRAQAEAAQNDPAINVFSGFTLLNLPNSQVNVPLSGAGSVDDAQRKFVVTRQDLINAGIPTNTDTIVVYFQLHLSRTFIWSNGLQAGYDVAPTDDMGAYQYSSEPFLSDQRPGSGFFPGSSGHARLNMGSGDKTVPIPIPPEPPGGISGFKWLDENGDGIWDNEEMALSGWRIFVSGEIDGIEFGADVLTDENGRYSFPNLTAGEWIVSEALQREEPEEDGFTQSYPFDGVTLGVSTAVEIDIAGRADFGWDVELNPISGNQNNLNFGNVPPPPILGTISGIKFHDRNANGVLDLPEEEGLAGWRIELYIDEDMTIPYAANPFQITDEDGFFTFSDLDLGTYYLKEAMTTEQAAAFQQTAPIPNKFEITVTEENDEVLDLEFGNVALSKITVEKQDDQGETLGGWEFKLFKFTGDPEDEEELEDENFWELIDTQTTDLEEEDGVVTFGGLLPGLYQVRETLKTGWAHIFPADGIEEVTITAGSTEILVFSNVELGKITVEKQDDQGETLGGWEFKLFMYDEDSEEIEEEDKWVLIDTKTTDLNVNGGVVTFDNLMPGRYEVRETLKNGWAFVDPIDGIIEVNLDAGDVEDLTFTNIELSKITVEKQDDQGETLGGWEFKLFMYDEDSEEIEEEDKWVLIDTKTTDLNVNGGVVTFDNLMPGRYEVRETLKNGWAFVDPIDGIIEVNLDAGDVEDLTFTNVELSKIVVDKQNEDQVRLGGWEFKLFMYDEDSEEIEEEDKWVLIDTKTTDLNVNGGVVTFDNLLPGLYKVVETEQDGWMIVTPLSGEFEITLTAGSTENRTFVNRLIPEIDCYDETAWGFNADTSIPFTDLGFSNWGWTNRIEESSTVTLQLIAGAGNNVIANGDVVGQVVVEYYDGSVTATYTMFAPYELAEAHLWIGETELPLREKQGNLYMTNAPGQFNYTGNVVNVGSFEGDIFVAAHAVAVIPCEEETAITSFYFSEEIFYEEIDELEIPGGAPGGVLDEDLDIDEEQEGVGNEASDIEQEQKEPEKEVVVEEPGESEEPDEASDVSEEDSGRPENPGGHGRGRTK